MEELKGWTKIKDAEPKEGFVIIFAKGWYDETGSVEASLEIEPYSAANIKNYNGDLFYWKQITDLPIEL